MPLQMEDNVSNDYVEYRRVLEACSVTQDGQSIFASLEVDAREGVERVFKALVDEPDGKLAQAFLDYRSYFKYDMWVRDPKHPELAPKSLNRHADKFSGGEKQTPFYISILACYAPASQRWRRRILAIGPWPLEIERSAEPGYPAPSTLLVTVLRREQTLRLAAVRRTSQ